MSMPDTPTPPSPEPPREREGESRCKCGHTYGVHLHVRGAPCGVCSCLGFAAASLPPSAGSGETELVEAARDLIAYALDMGADYTVRAVDFERLQSALAAHPAGPTREEGAEAAMCAAEDQALAREVATARRFLELHSHAVVDMRNRDASVVPIGVDWPTRDRLTGEED